MKTTKEQRDEWRETANKLSMSAFPVMSAEVGLLLCADLDDAMAALAIAMDALERIEEWPREYEVCSVARIALQQIRDKVKP